jgi:hypothetical protein
MKGGLVPPAPLAETLPRQVAVTYFGSALGFAASKCSYFTKSTYGTVIFSRASYFHDFFATVLFKIMKIKHTKKST